VTYWKPIASAPKDKIIDVWLGDADLSDVLFYCTPGTRRSPGWAWEDGKFRPIQGLSTSLPAFVQPTHWRELPDPPGDTLSKPASAKR
jgi:hypothetical protein